MSSTVAMLGSLVSEWLESALAC